MTFSSIPHHEIKLTYHNNTINIDPTALYLFQVSLSMSAIFSIIILFIVKKYSDYFLTENIMGNPYKLVYGVVRFAIKHKHPVRLRIAMTNVHLESIMESKAMVDLLQLNKLKMLNHS